MAHGELGGIMGYYVMGQSHWGGSNPNPCSKVTEFEAGKLCAMLSVTQTAEVYLMYIRIFFNNE